MERLAGAGGRLQPCRRGSGPLGLERRTGDSADAAGLSGQPRAASRPPSRHPQAVSRSAWGLRTAAQSVFAGIASGRIPTMRLLKSAQTL